MKNLNYAVVLLVGVLTGWLINSNISTNDTTSAKSLSINNADLEVDQIYPDVSDFVSIRPAIANLAKQTISSEEKAGLVFMREEEKLARDVYTTLYDRWGLQIFSNIAQSEQTHTEAVRLLLEKYAITDPIVDDTVGVFVNPDLQKLYDQLTAKGIMSVEEALRVGAFIEDLDISDLQKLINETDNDDIKLVYENLLRGSRNHLRSFVSQLTNRNQTYEPQFITLEEFKSITTSSRETGDSSGGRGWGRRN